MGTDTVTAKKLLKHAIRSEIDGRRFYTFLAEKTANPDAKRKLNNLARDEKRHEATLYKIFKKQYNEDVGDIPEKGIGVLSQFFGDLKAQEGKSEVQYIDLAIQAELAATSFYKDSAQSASDAEIKEIYQDMADEEFRHYESLQAEKAALGGNYYWFGFEGDAPMED